MGWPKEIPDGMTAVALFHCRAAKLLVVSVHDRDGNRSLYVRPTVSNAPYKLLVPIAPGDSLHPAVPNPAGAAVYYLKWSGRQVGEHYGWDFVGLFRVEIGTQPELLVGRQELGPDFVSDIIGFDESGESLSLVVSRTDPGVAQYGVEVFDVGTRTFRSVCPLETPFM